MTRRLSIAEKARAIRDVATYRPPLTVAIVGLSLVVGATEGIGLGFILPIVAVVQDGSGAEPSGPVRVFFDVYTALGLPFTLGFIVAGVAVVIGLRYAASFLASWSTAVLEADYRRHLRVWGFDTAIAAETTYFDQRGSDDMLNAIITQTGHASRTITRFVKVVRLSLICAAYALLALYLAPGLMVLTGVVLVGFMYGSRYAFESGFDVGDRVAEANERIQEAVQGGLQGFTEVKLFSLGREYRTTFRRAVDEQTRATIKQHRNQAAILNVNRFAAAATVFGLIYLGVTMASLSLPSLGVFLFAMFRLGPRLSSLNRLLYEVDNDLPHLVRTQAFVERLERNRESWGDRSVPGRVGRVDFEAVDFAYPDGDDVLRDVSFSIDRGEFVAFVGPSGAGKSTIVSLLAGLYRPTGGRILADSTSIHRFDLDEWRSRVAVVRQAPYLFNDTLRYNLTIGNRDATDAAIDEVCEIAQVTEFVDDLPDGYDTVLGEDGVRLSGGQRQRVAIARALLVEADLLVLDEATSELDSHLEARVHDGIERLDREYAILAVAHRLSTVTDADAIYLLEDGSIVESGTHESLLRENGVYSDLYAAQVDQSVGASQGVGY